MIAPLFLLRHLTDGEASTREVGGVTANGIPTPRSTFGFEIQFDGLALLHHGADIFPQGLTCFFIRGETAFTVVEKIRLVVDRFQSTLVLKNLVHKHSLRLIGMYFGIPIQ